jgi:biotin carboxylase
VKTVLFVGAGRHQRRAILQARERGLRVVGVDRNPDAPGLHVADIAEAVDFTDIDAVTDVARRHHVDGALTVSADRAVPVVAAVTERLGLPTIGTEVARRMRNKIVMRRILADDGVPQPPFAAVRSLSEGRRALSTVGLPAVLKPADSGGQRGIFLVESVGEIEAHLHEALAASPTQEAILEEYVEGTEMNGIVIARDGDSFPLTLSDRLRPPGIGFGVGWIHVYPASAYADQLTLSERVAARCVEALGLRDGIAFPQLIAHPDGSVAVVEVAARIPGGQMADLVRHATGVDLVEVALRFALMYGIVTSVLPEPKQAVVTGGALLKSKAWAQIEAWLGSPRPICCPKWTASQPSSPASCSAHVCAARSSTTHARPRCASRTAWRRYSRATGISPCSASWRFLSRSAAVRK